VQALLSTFGAILEYDGYLYQKISFLFDQNNFSFIAHFSIPSEFPAKQPVATLQAIKELKNGKPFSISYDSWPYSPRWNSEEMAKRIRAWILENTAAFQKACLEDNTLT